MQKNQKQGGDGAVNYGQEAIVVPINQQQQNTTTTAAAAEEKGEDDQDEDGTIAKQHAAKFHFANDIFDSSVIDAPLELPEMPKCKRARVTSFVEKEDRTRLCMVCEKAQKPKYRAPCCQLMYCSVTCFQEHKITFPDCGKKGVDGSSGDGDAAALTTATATISRCRNIPVALVRSTSQRCTLPGLLSDTQLKALETCAELKSALQSKELQTLISNIDGAENRIESLELARTKIPEFAEFIETVLDVIHWTPPQ
jgi:hypothetical protein